MYPQLFGLHNSNRNFGLEKSWGKNEFNSTFPAALCCYIHSIGEKAKYLSILDGIFGCHEISIPDAFGIDPADPEIFFDFEGHYAPFEEYVSDTLPRTDIVIRRKKDGPCLADVEVKMTVMPDNTTCKLSDAEYGCEIVVRPDTIVYLACSIAKGLASRLDDYFKDHPKISDWESPAAVLPGVNRMIRTLKKISVALEENQSPVLLQPVWKTMGKSPHLAENCLDAFFWSDAGFAHFITEIARHPTKSKKINRQTRTAIWLYRMLLGISRDGRVDHKQIINGPTYKTKNDKAFASSGHVTRKFMKCQRLEKPLIRKDQIKNIILGNGQDMLSPERRFDAIVYNSPGLFK